MITRYKNINSIQQKKINNTTVIAIVYAKDWYGEIMNHVRYSLILPDDFVVCQWHDFHDGLKSNIEGRTTIAICRNKENAELIYNLKVNQMTENLTICNYEIAWIGKCKEPAVENCMCEEHKNKKCVSCGAPATHDCPETGQFVCGAPLCNDCEHTNAVDGTNGGVGFFRISELPNGMKEHCKKSEQKYFPWYVMSLAKDHSEIKTIVRKFKRGLLSYLDADKQVNDFCIKLNEKEKLLVEHNNGNHKA